MDVNPRFRSFIDESEALPRAGGQKLSAYLIMPIQRMYGHATHVYLIAQLFDMLYPAAPA